LDHGWQACAGHELVMLANSFSDDRQIIGIDLAEGMVDLANARCKEAGVRSVLYLCHQNHIAKVMKL